MRFVFHYPETTGRDADMLAPGPVAVVAKAAEDAGFHGFSFTEHPAPTTRWLDTGGHQSLDPFVALGHVAAVTERLRLLTYLSVAPYRNPLLLAKAAATVDILSGGRFILGLGTGYLKSEFRALGVDFDERNALFDEALDVLRLHWSGEPFSYSGRHFDARDTISRPRPPRGTIPVWIGGNSALTRRRVAERADGWMPLVGPAELFATTRTAALGPDADLAPLIADLRTAAGERADGIDVITGYNARGLAAPDADFAGHRETIASHEAAGVTWMTVSCPAESVERSLDFIARFGRACIDD